MPVIKFEDVTLVYPFVQVNGLFFKKEKQKALEKQKQMPYVSNEGVVAVQHFSAVIRDGEFVVIMGPSGSGKTSVLRMLAGLERPSLGKIYFDNECLNGVKPEDRDIAMVFQNYAIYPNQTVFDNIAFPLKNLHMPRNEIEEKVEEMLNLLKLKGKENRTADELSGGEKQRVAIARALVRKPKVFLLDEPFSNLDGLMRSTLRTELKRIQKQLGITFIYVTHDQKDALLLGDRIIVLKDGITQQDDSPSNVYNYPQNRFCAQFVGFPSMNIFDALVVKNGSFTLFGKTFRLSAQQVKALKNGTLSIGLRPCDITVCDDGVEATVDYVELDGIDLIIHALIDGVEVTAVERSDNQNESKYLPNQRIKLAFDENDFYYFDSEGKCL